MAATYRKNDLKSLEDRFENYFSLLYETNEIPDTLVDTRETPYPVIRSKLINENYSLIICLPRLPVYKVLKKAELLKETFSFRLLQISSANYTSEIEDFLVSTEYMVTFFWLKDHQEVVYELPETSQERIRLSNLSSNQLYQFWIEMEECTIAIWGEKTRSEREE